MNHPKAKPTPTDTLRRHLLGLTGLWTALIVAVLAWGFSRETREASEQAKINARMSIDKDVVFRRWVAQHGGVYVPPSTNTPPNPHLAHLKHRDVTTIDGKALTFINPAYMTRQIHELQARQQGAWGHITSLRPIRPENAADAWETNALRAFEAGEPEVASIESLNQIPYMRLMRSLVTEESCLKCHAQQGYKVGDIRGGISASVPMEPLWAIARARKTSLALAAGLLWLIGLAGIGAGGRALRQRMEERDQAQAALQRQQRDLRTLLDTLPGHAFFKRIDGTYQAANKPFCDAVGCSPEQIVGKKDEDLFPREQVEQYRAEDRRLLDGLEAAFDAEEVRLVGDEPRTIATRKVPLTNESGQVVGLIGLGLDVTQLKKAEQERSEMAFQLQQAQRLESVGRLAAGIAHEINTPTQYIGDNVRYVQDAFNDLRRLLRQYERLGQAAEQQGLLPEVVSEVASTAQTVDADYLISEVPKALEQSLEGVNRVANIVRAMREFSHPGTPEKSFVNLNRSIESTITVARNEWKYVADLELDLEPSLTPVMCLPGEFNQVILNLVINAAHAIAEKVGGGSKGKGTIKVHTHRDGDWVEVRIEDTGAGISDAVRNRMFEPFFTTKPVGKGTGQGLAIARSVIVEKHGGTITFESEEGKGTTFVIRLPIQPLPNETCRKAA